MWFLAKDRKIPISDLVFSDNLASYHSVLSFTSPAVIYADSGVIKTDFAEYEVAIESQTQLQNDVMKVDCITRAVDDAFNSTTAGYTGRCTLDSLFAKLGYGYYSDCKSNNTYFSIPQCKVVSLFDNLTKFASFANGGGAHFYMSMDGVVHGYDYKLIKDKGNATIWYGSILSRSIKTDWHSFTPSEYDIYTYNPDNSLKRESFVIVEGFGRSVVNLCDTTGVWRECAKQELTNSFYNKWYNGYTLTVSVAAGTIPTLGQLVDLNGDGRTFIVKAVSIAYNEIQEVPSITAVLISNPIFEA